MNSDRPNIGILPLQYASWNIRNDFSVYREQFLGMVSISHFNWLLISGSFSTLVRLLIDVFLTVLPASCISYADASIIDRLCTIFDVHSLDITAVQQHHYTAPYISEHFLAMSFLNDASAFFGLYNYFNYVNKFNNNVSDCHQSFHASSILARTEKQVNECFIVFISSLEVREKSPGIHVLCRIFVSGTSSVLGGRYNKYSIIIIRTCRSTKHRVCTEGKIINIVKLRRNHKYYVESRRQRYAEKSIVTARHSTFTTTGCLSKNAGFNHTNKCKKTEDEGSQKKSTQVNATTNQVTNVSESGVYASRLHNEIKRNPETSVVDQVHCDNRIEKSRKNSTSRIHKRDFGPKLTLESTKSSFSYSQSTLRRK
ncbi:hypothetical protein ANN_21215 [Periplaneta americana]|uniref:Uncharacterized protein n=1 Tax=Periplaneta americana TaxID=6978 RepID=A0ABQ8SG09_PERAM|nr:hypothetical protein ANN_21215 [Periplaneta americana]